MANTEPLPDDQAPLVLIVPGLGNSGPDHWQSHWEAEMPYCRRVELGMWDDPHRNTWINQLNLAIRQAGRPVILVAHSLGCHAVAWWAEYEKPRDGLVAGALLVAPPEVEGDVDRRLSRFAPAISSRLPFVSILAASRNDHYMQFGRAQRLARSWGSRLVDVGPLGHINADSGIRDWPYGKYLLDCLLAATSRQRGPFLAGRSVETLLARHCPQLVIGRVNSF